MTIFVMCSQKQH